ncbi:hypothetical protein C8R45DRAFT_955476 [Mycena sanguinolenta]|nr:hypothetical protein C8R45DRAFT_955476 [Mycena sanguinolenta]
MDSTLSARHSAVPLDNYLGAWLIGLIASSCVFGITTLQVYLYYTKYCCRDGLFLKSFVGALMVLDTVHLALLSASFYGAAVSNFSDSNALAQPSWSLLTQIPVAVVIGTMVQFFYAYRIWVLSNRSSIIPALILACSLANFGMSIAYTRTMFQLAAAAKKGTPFSTTSVVSMEVASLAVEMACDMLIAGGMVFTLMRNKSEFVNTNRAINTLVTYTVKSGVLNLMFAVCSLVSWITSTKTLIYAPFFFVLTRLYGCSFMSILNSRDHVREQMSTGGSTQAMVSLPTRPSSGVSRPEQYDGLVAAANPMLSTGSVFRDTKSYV